MEEQIASALLKKNTLEEGALALPDSKTSRALTISVHIQTVWSWTGVMTKTSGQNREH